MQKPGLADPSLLLDQDAMHNCYLAGRTTKAEGSNPRPCPNRFAKRDGGFVGFCMIKGQPGFRHVQAPLAPSGDAD
jgi:hypothetical protein